MLVFLRIVSVLLWLIAAFLIAAVINAVSSTNGARAGVAIAYVVGAIILVIAGVWLWRLRSGARRVSAS